MAAASLKNKDLLLYEEMFKTYFSSLCYFAQKYVADFDSCKEIVHKVFVGIWEKRDSFDFEKQAKSYLFTSVYNRCMNHIRDEKRLLINDAQGITEEIADSSSHSANIEASELEGQIWKVINSLPDKCKEVFILNRFKKKKYSEIAVQMDISVKTVETHMSKALRILRDNLKVYIHLLILIFMKKLW